MSNASSGSWEKFKLGDALQHRRERARGSEQLLSVTQDRGVVRQIDAGRRDISSDDKSAYWRVYAGDIVYNTMRMWQGVVGRSDFEGIVSPAYTVCRPTSLVNARFLAYKLKHPAMIAEFYRFSQGLVSDTWNLKYSSFSTISVCLPTVSTQVRIAEIAAGLDEAIATINQTIHKRKAVNTGVAQALLNRLQVTPAPLIDFLSSKPRNGFSPSEVEPWTGVVVLGLGCLTPEGFTPKQLKNVPANNPRYSGALLSDGDLLMSRSNTLELVGLIGRYRDIGTACLYPDLMMKLTPRSMVRPSFLEISLRDETTRAQIKSLAQGTSGSMAKISAGSVAGIRVKIPDLQGQDRILGIVSAGMSQIEDQEREQSKLRLLKHGLMDDLLTGRVQVTIGGMERVGTG